MTSTSVGPPPLRWATRLLLLEAGAAGLLAAFLIYQGVTREAANLGDALAVTGFVLVIGAALGGLAAALARRKARARAPAIVLQLVTVMAAVFLAGSGLAWLGVPVALLGILVTTLLLAPATTTALAE